MVKKTKNIRKKHNKRNKKGGFLFSKKALPEICVMTNLDDLKTSAELNTRYETCCPKNFLGFKNRSPLCTNLENKIKEIEKSEVEVQSSLGLNADISQTPLVSQDQNISTPMAPVTKPWYQFWGGKKHKRTTRNKKTKHSKKRKTRKQRK